MERALRCYKALKPLADKMKIPIYFRKGIRREPIFYRKECIYVIEAKDYKGKDEKILRTILKDIKVSTREEKEQGRYLSGAKVNKDNTFIHPQTLEKIRIRKFIDRDKYIIENEYKFIQILEKYQTKIWIKDNKNPIKEKIKLGSNYKQFLLNLLKPSIKYYNKSLKNMIKERCKFNNIIISKINLLYRSKLMNKYIIEYKPKYVINPTQNQTIVQYIRKRNKRNKIVYIPWSSLTTSNLNLPLPNILYNPWPLSREKDYMYNKRIYNIKPIKYIPPKFIPEIVITKLDTYITKKPKTPPIDNIINPFYIPFNYKEKLNYISKLSYINSLKDNIQYKQLFFWNKIINNNRIIKNWTIMFNKNKYYIKFNRYNKHIRHFRWYEYNNYLERESNYLNKLFNNYKFQQEEYGLILNEWRVKDRVKIPLKFKKHYKYKYKLRGLNKIYNNKNKIERIEFKYKRGRNRHKFPLIKNNFYIWTWNRFLYINNYLFKKSQPSLSINLHHRLGYLKSSFDNYKPKVYPIVKENHLRFPNKILYTNFYHIDYNLINTLRINKNIFNNITHIIKYYPQFYGLHQNWNQWEKQDLIALIFSCVNRSYYNHLLHWITDYQIRECFYTNDIFDNDFAWSRSIYNNNKYYPKFPFYQKLNTKTPLIFITNFPYYFHKDNANRFYPTRYSI